MGEGPNIMEMLWNMSNNPIDNFFHEDFKKVLKSLKGCAHEVIEYALKMKRVVEVVAFVSLFVMDMANAFATITPRLLEVALRFDNLISSILSLMKNRNQIYGELASMETKLKEVQSKYEMFECDLEESSKKEKKVAI